MFRKLKFLIAFLIAAVIGVLCIANSGNITVEAWPDLTEYGVPASPQQELPLYVFALLCGLVGFLLGAAREWAREGRVRSTARQAKREAAQLKQKVSKLSGDDDDLPALASR